ncbi:MAG TPA: serine hydrolase domain-containing protein [Chloroflexota bacterium]|nr:serine hydrolase domain-containing protein [Chloroflexota bacterium]HUM72121.1 serine hydrolase domain-containing protein [Chloroflexota bacterium]
MNKFQKKLQVYLQNKTERGEFSGVVLLTQNDQEIFAGAYGEANRVFHVPNHMNFRFEVASLTKLFTAVAILQLVDQGILGLDTAVIPYLGLSHTSISDDVTVYHLLTHSSGIADDADEEAGEDYADLWRERPNYAVTELVDFLPQFIHKPPNFPPGTAVRYNNVGYILLGLMIEKATGLAYRNYIQQNLFAPTGMNRSGFFHMADVVEDVAESYTAVMDTDGRTTWQRPIYMRPPIGSPDGGAYVTAKDMAIFITAIHDGRLLSPELTHALLTPKLPYAIRETYNTHYGYALLFVFDKQDKLLFYLGQGEDNGVSSKAVYFPSHQIQAILLANQDYCTWPLIWQIHKLLLE